MLEPAGSFGVWLKEDLTTEGAESAEEDEAAKLATHGRVGRARDREMRSC